MDENKKLKKNYASRLIISDLFPLKCICENTKDNKKNNTLLSKAHSLSMSENE